MQREHEEEVQQEARLPHKMRHQRWESYVIQFCTTYGQQSFFSVHMANNSGIIFNFDCSHLYKYFSPSFGPKFSQTDNPKFLEIWKVKTI